MLLTVRDDPDDFGQIGRRDGIDGRPIAQFRMRPGQHAVQIPRIRVRTPLHEGLGQLLLEWHQLPIGNALSPVAQTDGQQFAGFQFAVDLVFGLPGQLAEQLNRHVARQFVDFEHFLALTLDRGHFRLRNWLRGGGTCDSR